MHSSVQLVRRASLNSVITHYHLHPKPFQSHLEGSFGNAEISTVQDNALGVVKHRHVDNSAASEGHVVEVRVQGEAIA